MFYVFISNHTVNKISTSFNEHLAACVIFRFLKRMQNEAGEYVDMYIPRKWSVDEINTICMYCPLFAQNNGYFVVANMRTFSGENPYYWMGCCT